MIIYVIGNFSEGIPSKQYLIKVDRPEFDGCQDVSTMNSKSISIPLVYKLFFAKQLISLTGFQKNFTLLVRASL